MIYTIGDISAYEHNFKTVPGFAKLGRTLSYEGGSVWQTRAGAEHVAANSPGYAVYGVLADWSTDVEPNTGPLGEGSLLVTRRIVHVDPETLVFKIVLNAAHEQYLGSAQDREYISTLIGAAALRIRLQIGDTCRIVKYIAGNQGNDD